jgi:predicted dehydrogenase
MTRSVLNWGVLGASNFARKTMAPAINGARRSRLFAVATRDPAKAAPFADLAPGLQRARQLRGAAGDPEIDAVYVPLPNGLHVEWTERAARAGKSVLCEKPIGLSIGDVERLIALRDELGVFIAEAWMPAHHPQWAKVREIVSGGGIGRLHTVTGVFTYGLSDPANVRNSADLGGGALRDVGVYPVGCLPLRHGAGAGGQRRSQWEDGIDASTWVRARRGIRPVPLPRLHAHDKRQEMVFEGDGGWLVVHAPFNAGRVWSGRHVLRRADGAEEVFRFPTAPAIREPGGGGGRQPAGRGGLSRCRWKCRSERSGWSTRCSTPSARRVGCADQRRGRCDDAPERRRQSRRPRERRTAGRAEKDHLGWRLIYMLLIAFMLSISQTVLTVLTIIQFIIMLVNNGEKNAAPGGFRDRSGDLDGQGRALPGGGLRT